MRSADRWAPIILAMAALCVPHAGHAEYPPGPLSRAHAQLEGLASCTQCHVLRDRASPERCLACHREIASRVPQRSGLHTRLPTDRPCGRCHSEHAGRDVPLIDWGAKGRDGFEHARTGWELRGKHAAVSCAECHRRDRVQAEDVRMILALRPEKQTYLGASPACAGCHRDVHRGQLSSACDACHGERGWKPAERFQHAKTGYPLDGKHERVGCRECHRLDSPLARPCPPPLACREETSWQLREAVVRYRPLAHSQCEDCHENTHAVEFSEKCGACHSTASWLRVDEPGFVSRHAETRYPLEGAHIKATCRSCHGPWGRDSPRFIGIGFRTCAACHPDAHTGQMARSGRRAQDCAWCHAVDAFAPVRFSADDHAMTRYPLVGGHRAVACNKCHTSDPGLAAHFPPEARRELEREGRPVRVAPVRLELPGRPFERCDGCHKDPHGGQMADRIAREGCGGCHEQRSFKLLRFDHQATPFPLTGKHTETACAACHPRERIGEKLVVRYRGVPKRCAACHDDAHAGQLALDAQQRSECERCHDPASWKKTRFVHSPPFTDYVLEGRHAQVTCERCHFKVAVAGREIVRYRPLPADCERCHADEHRGAFTGYEP